MSLFLIAQRLLNRVRDVHVAILLGITAGIMIVGGIIFSATDHVGVGTGIYWAITTATTVGYGDVIPHNGASQVVAAGVMLTAIPLAGASFALFAGTTVIRHLRRLLGLDTELPNPPYTVVYGGHAVVPTVLAELVDAGEQVVLVAPDRPAGLDHKVHFLAGDPTDEELVKASKPEQANRGFIACTADADTLIVAVALRTSSPDLELYALSESPRVAKALGDLGVSRTLSTTRLIGHAVAKSLETPSAGDLIFQLISSTDYELRERTVDGDANRPLSQIRSTTGALVFGIARDGKVNLGINDDPTLGPGDRLVELVPCAENRQKAAKP